MAKAKKKRRRAAQRREARYVETIILRMPEGTKDRIAEAISLLEDADITESAYCRRVLLHALDDDLTPED